MKCFLISIFFILFSCQNVSFKEQKNYLNVKVKGSRSFQLKGAYKDFFSKERNALYLFKSPEGFQRFSTWIERIRKNFFLPVLGEELKERIKKDPNFSSFLQERIILDNLTKSLDEKWNRNALEDYMIMFLVSPKSPLKMPFTLPSIEEYLESDYFYALAAKKQGDVKAFDALINGVDNIAGELQRVAVELKKEDIKEISSSLKKREEMLFSQQDSEFIPTNFNDVYNALFEFKGKNPNYRNLNSFFDQEVPIIDPFNLKKNPTSKNPSLTNGQFRFNEISRKVLSLEEESSSSSYLTIKDASKEVKAIVKLLKMEVEPRSDTWKEGSLLEKIQLEEGYDSLFGYHIKLMGKELKFKRKGYTGSPQKYLFERLFRITFTTYHMLKMLGKNQLEGLSNNHKRFKESYIALSQDDFLISLKNRESYLNAICSSIEILKDFIEILTELFLSYNREYATPLLDEANSILRSMEKFRSQTDNLTDPLLFKGQLALFELTSGVIKKITQLLVNFLNFQDRINKANFEVEKETLRRNLISTLDYFQALEVN